jgi:hypothetical protein
MNYEEPLCRGHTPAGTRRRLIAAISAAVDASEADRLDDIGEELKNAVATLGPHYAPTALTG